MSKLLKGTPLARYHREAIAERRLGRHRECVLCGETRVLPLEPNSNPRVCTECRRELEGKTIMDKHHVAGRANSDITIPIPANDHRAELSEAQREWPEKTPRNPDHCPLLAGAASIRGCADTIGYLIKNFLWVAEMLEKLNEYLNEKLGRNWWSNTEFDKYTPRKRKHNAKS